MNASHVRKAILPLLAALLLSACAGPRVGSDYDPQTDFSAYRSWAWLPDPAPIATGDPRIDNPLVEERIREAIEAELAAKGYRRVPREEADFLAGYLVTVEKKLSSGGVSTTIGYGVYRGGSGVGISVGGPGDRIREYREGTLIISIEDAASGKLVWQGSSARRLGEAQGPEESRRIIREVVAQILAAFPPG